MITRADLAELSRPPGGMGETVLLRTLDQIEATLAMFPTWYKWDQVLVRHCQCCGERAEVVNGRIARCRKHIGRNPCAIEGCGRTFKASGNGQDFWYANDQVICGHHWRELVPPGSPERRVFNRLRRLAKKMGGWTNALSGREHRIWGRIIARAQGRARGDVDEAEIKRLFGWD